MSDWKRHAKIAFVGSHGIRKTTAAHAFAGTMQRAGRSVEYGREVVRDNPLGINESATGEAQLWVLVSQVRQELELTPKAEVLVTDRGVMDNFAYYLRACGRQDPFQIEPFVRAWSATYDLVVRLLPDIALRADGVRSTSDAFRDEIEQILDEALPAFLAPGRLVAVRASEVTSEMDWWPIAEQLAANVGEPLPAAGGSRGRPSRHRRARGPFPGPGAEGRRAGGGEGGDDDGGQGGGKGAQLELGLPPQR
ncbi:MAG: ATP-binding protein [Candidatus Limnocylindrales bacterium]